MRSRSFQETSTKRSLFTRSTSEKTTKTTSSSDTTSVTQSSVVSVYRVGIAGTTCTATVTWSSTRINHSLIVYFVRPTEKDVAYTFKMELKPWPFWGKKGYRNMDVGSRPVEVFWDFRSVKFVGNGSPEPLGGFYVAFVCYGEVVLCLGDDKKDAFKRTRCRPSLVDALLLSKRENVFGKKCFSARARFDERKREHDIVVENSITGSKEPEMWISIDGIVLIHVSNLQWKFRGNDTVVVETMPVQVFWDVHNWLCANNLKVNFLFSNTLAYLNITLILPTKHILASNRRAKKMARYMLLAKWHGEEGCLAACTANQNELTI